MMLMLSTVMAIMKPGEIHIQGIDFRMETCLAASSMNPHQLGVGIWTPSPRWFDAASIRMASATPQVAATVSGPTRFGNRNGFIPDASVFALDSGGNSWPWPDKSTVGLMYSSADKRVLDP